MKTELSENEAAIIRQVIAKVAIESRTGEIGITHGMNRFVGTGIILKKDGRKLLTEAAKKLGIAGGVPEKTK